MDNIFVIIIAGPEYIFFARLKGLADGVQAGYKISILSQDIQNGLAHARHDFHVADDVR